MRTYETRSAEVVTGTVRNQPPCRHSIQTHVSGGLSHGIQDTCVLCPTARVGFQLANTEDLVDLSAATTPLDVKVKQALSGAHETLHPA